MKNNSRKHVENEEEGETKKDIQSHRRRPHKNLVKYWQEHSDDYDDIDEFFER